MTSNEDTIAIAGHAGIGHTHCPGGLIQDDTAGFAVAGAILRDLTNADTHVHDVAVDVPRGVIRITTVDGGVSETAPRRGITPAEASMMQRAAGGDALLCQSVAVNCLGRMYGQGVLETPSCLAAALANAAVATFRCKDPERFRVATESIPGSCGLIGGMQARMDSAAISILATVNASCAGLGPNEDLEGNVALGSKRLLMQSLGMLRCPTIVLEGKAYSPGLSDRLRQNTFLIRANRRLDNIIVAEALYDSALALGVPAILLDNVFPHTEGVLKAKGVEVAEKIIRIAERLRTAERGADKVGIVAELARVVSEECGGMSFMTNGVHDVVRQVGMIPGTAAVLSMLVTKSYLAHWKIPLVEQEDVTAMKGIVLGAISRLAQRSREAQDVLEREYQDLTPLEALTG